MNLPRLLSAGFALRCAVAVLALACGAGSAHAADSRVPPAANPPAQDQAASDVQVTVTPEMGDVGGKLFGRVPDRAHTRHYYIAAEPVLWDFAPAGQDPVCGKPFPPSLLLNRSSWKIHYVQYADANFAARVLPEPRLGLLGPVLRGVIGDTIEVTFLNRAWLPLSMHPHGVRYDKDNEGSYYKPAPGRGAAIAPGAKYTYVWQLDEASGPRPDEPSSKAWLYHSHVAGDEEVNLGAIGFIVVTDPARARPDGTPKDVDREMGALFTIFDESASNGVAVQDNDDGPPPADANAPASAPAPVQMTWAESQQIVEEKQRLTINGLTYGNLPGLEMNEGERVRWYLFGLGSEDDFHTAHWHGLRVTDESRRRTDTVELLPGSMKTADLVADNPGQWLLHCHVSEHMTRGMYASVTVHPTAATDSASRAPEAAFFGMPQAEQTLQLTSVEIARTKTGGVGEELYIDGQVTVPNPFPVAKNSFTITLGNKSVQLRPDGSGLCAAPEAMLLVKNLSPLGNGNVMGGRLVFELTLRGPGWAQELKQLKMLTPQNQLAKNPVVDLGLLIGAAHHRTTHAIVLEAQQ